MIAERDDIYGDGVNIAARLEGLAEPGGICISRMVQDQIRDKLPYAFEDLGNRSVKNIARPVRVYAFRPKALVNRLALGAPAPQPISQLVAPRLSIVVLPFVNLSDDREQQYFADGITEDLTTDLSRMADMVVISRSTAFTYQDKRVDTKQIGRELCVRYVLEGSVRRSGNQVRVNAQLIDAETSAHLWAERFDRDVSDLFALQNEITSRIARALNIELVAAEAARPTDNPDAMDYVFRGRSSYLKPNSREKWDETIGFFERALALDPGLVNARSLLACALADRALSGVSYSAAADLARAEGLVAQALAQAPRSALPHLAKGQLMRARGLPEEAIPEYETAIALNRNSVSAMFALGQCKLLTGSINEDIRLVEQAIRLAPRGIANGILYLEMGRANLLQSRIEEAVQSLEKARSINPEHPSTRAFLASTYALMGKAERADTELAEARRLSTDNRYSSITRLRAAAYWGVPKIQALYEATYFAGLRKAGVPEE